MTDEPKTVCGIVMPISHTDEQHTAVHWQKVKGILETAIQKAGCTPKPVWEGGDSELIQGRILQNIFENEIIVCDISTRNANVMLEWGMRLTTKKPTLVVAEFDTPLPFDTHDINVEWYDPSLDWKATEDFIAKLATAIEAILAATMSGSFRPYLEHFQFETVKPSTVSVTAEERLERLMIDISERLAGLESTSLTFGDITRPAGPTNYLHGSPISRGFLSEANSRRLAEQDPPWPGRSPPTSLEPGDTVAHQKLGSGTVASFHGDAVSVNFDDGIRRVVRLDTLQKPPL